jgi:hypothetical protein
MNLRCLVWYPLLRDLLVFRTLQDMSNYERSQGSNFAGICLDGNIKFRRSRGTFTAEDEAEQPVLLRGIYPASQRPGYSQLIGLLDLFPAVREKQEPN